MPLDLIIGAAVGAAAASSSVRRVVRRGLVYGLAGLLVTYDKVAKVTHAVVTEASHEAEAKGHEETKLVPVPVPAPTLSPTPTEAPPGAPAVPAPSA